jgi:hypothetical protein
MPCNSINLAHPELPVSMISSDGNTYVINPDFHVVLACLERLQDPDRNDLEKASYLSHHFFLKKTPPDMGGLFTAFVSGTSSTSGEADEENNSEPLMDFQQDSGVLYASFRQTYGINLLTDKLHWIEFQELLSALGPDTPFGKRVQLRSINISALPENERLKWQRMRDNVAIIPKMSAAEEALQKELDRRLAAGEDPGEIISQLKEA